MDKIIFDDSINSLLFLPLDVSSDPDLIYEEIPALTDKGIIKVNYSPNTYRFSYNDLRNAFNAAVVMISGKQIPLFQEWYENYKINKNGTG